MDELLMCTGAILVTIIGSYWFILSEITDARKAIIIKQDAIMAKLIDAKFR